MSLLVCFIAWCGTAGGIDADDRMKDIVDPICDERLSLDQRFESLEELLEVKALTDDQLRRLHKLLDGSNVGFTRRLIYHLGRLGNNETLRELLKRQLAYRNKRLTVALDGAIYRLATKLDVDVWEELHPRYRKLWIHFGRKRPSGKDGKVEEKREEKGRKRGKKRGHSDLGKKRSGTFVGVNPDLPQRHGR